MLPHHRSALRLVLVGLMASACTDQTPPTAIPAGMTPLAAAAGANNQKVKVKTLQFTANTLRIDGPSFNGDVSIGNSGTAITVGVVLRAEITQGTVSKRAVDDTPVSCPGALPDPGKLPTGTCDMTFAAKASNAGSAGTLVPGSATFTLHVIQKTDAGETELASKSVTVNLVGSVNMTVTIAPTNVLIDGAAATATAVIQNPANSLQGVLIQGWVVQGTAPNQTRVATGGKLVTCGSNAGVLPTGTCTIPISVAPSGGGLQPGDATFELQLAQSSGSTNTTIDVESIPINLISNIPRFTNVTIQSATLAIGATNVSFTADVQNGGGPRTNVIVVASIQQFTNGSVVQKLAGGLAVSCGGAPGALPTTGNGSCSSQGTFNVPADAEGTGALKPGAARLIFQLTDGVGNLDIKRFDVTLTGSVAITGVIIAETVPLATGSILYTAVIQNNGASLSNIGIQNWIIQGTTRRAAGGQQIQCGSQPAGALATGSCFASTFLSAQNDPTSGTGILTPGPATLEIELNQNGVNAATLTKTTVPIVLAVSGPTIINIEFASLNVLIGGETTYNVTFYNPGSAISGVGGQGSISQGTVKGGAGGFAVECPGQQPGVLPAGLCTMTGVTLNTSNQNFGTWQPGPADFLLQLNQGTTVLTSQTRTIFFYQIQ